MGHKKNAIIYAIFGLFWVLGACMPEIRNPYDPKTDEFWIVQALRCNILGECTEICEAPAWQATASFPSTGASAFQGIAVDASCNSYAVGYIQGTSTYSFGNQSVAGKFSGNNAIIVKYAANGEALWARSVQSATGATQFLDVALDRAGNAYAVGNLTGSNSFDFGSGTTTGAGGTGNAIIAKFDPNGNNIWSSSITAVDNTSSADSSFAAIAINEADQIFVAGKIIAPSSGSSRTYTFAPGVTATTPYTGAAGAFNAVLLRYDTNGTALLAETASTAPDQSNFLGIAARGAFVYAVGTLSGYSNFIFDSKTLSGGATSASNAAILKFDTNFVAQNGSWASTSAGNSQFLDVAVDAAGNTYAVGSLNNTTTYSFGSGVTATNTSASLTALLVRYNAAGGGVNARVPGSQPFASIFRAVDVDPFGNVHLGGELTGGPFTFNSLSLTGATTSFSNAFYLRISSASVAEDGKTTSVAQNASGFQDLAVDPFGRIHAAGNMTGANPFDFGLGSISASSTSGLNPLILKY